MRSLFFSEFKKSSISIIVVLVLIIALMLNFIYFMANEYISAVVQRNIIGIFEKARALT